MSDASRPGDGREDRDRAWVCEVLDGSRAHLDLLYDAYFSRVYRMAYECTASHAEAEKVTEAVFRTVLRDLASRTETDVGPTLVHAILAATRQELGKLASRIP